MAGFFGFGAFSTPVGQLIGEAGAAGHWVFAPQLRFAFPSSV